MKRTALEFQRTEARLVVARVGESPARQERADHEFFASVVARAVVTTA